MPAGTYDLRIEQGADLFETFTWANADGSRRPFTGWVAHAQIRTRPGGRQLLDLTPYLSVVQGVEADGATGEGLRLQVPGSATATLDVPAGAWDLLLIQPGPPERREYLLEGAVQIRKAVTAYVF